MSADDPRPAASGGTTDGERDDAWWTRLFLAAQDAVDSVPYAVGREYPVPHAAAFRAAVEPLLAAPPVSRPARERELLKALLLALWEEDAGEPVEGLDGVSEAIDAYLARLLPVVDQIAERRASERAAAELDRAANEWRDRDRNTDLWLRDRAAALRAATGEGAGQ